MRIDVHTKRCAIRGRDSTLSVRCIMAMNRGIMPNVAQNRIRPGDRQKKAPAVPGLLDDWRPHGDSNPGVHRER
ncbi:hypothetical protein, partial [Xanthomonas euvesicatoria]|uniref:hypothetical protein n=2 Tax=Xanthomonas euvesicatoria TaxID=456327 RepID=UPI001B7FE6D5